VFVTSLTVAATVEVAGIGLEADSVVRLGAAVAGKE
jgi:hypothetical protein